jgi:hypothetical protein
VHRRPVRALQVLSEAKRLSGLPKGLLEHPASPDQLNPAHVLSFEEEEVERVEAGRSATDSYANNTDFYAENMLLFA